MPFPYIFAQLLFFADVAEMNDDFFLLIFRRQPQHCIFDPVGTELDLACRIARLQNRCNPVASCDVAQVFSGCFPINRQPFTGVSVGKPDHSCRVRGQNPAVAAVQHAGLIAVHILNVAVHPNQFLVGLLQLLRPVGHFAFQHHVDPPEHQAQKQRSQQTQPQVTKVFLVVIGRIVDRLAKPLEVNLVEAPVVLHFAQPFVELGQQFFIAATDGKSVTFGIDEAADAFHPFHRTQSLHDVLSGHPVADHGVDFPCQ